MITRDRKFESTFGRSNRASRRLYRFTYTLYRFSLSPFIYTDFYARCSARLQFLAGLPPRINFISPLIILTRQSPSSSIFFHPVRNTRATPITICRLYSVISCYFPVALSLYAVYKFPFTEAEDYRRLIILSRSFSTSPKH